MNKLLKTQGFDKSDELFTELDKAIVLHTEEIISKEEFVDFILKINQNPFDITIDQNLIKNNREDFNESGLISYTDNDDYELESSYDD